MTIPTTNPVGLARVRTEFVTLAGLLSVAAPASANYSSRTLVSWLVALQSSYLVANDGFTIRNAAADTFISLFKNPSGVVLPPNCFLNGSTTGANINQFDNLALWKGMYLVWRRWNGSTYYDGASTL